MFRFIAAFSLLAACQQAPAPTPGDLSTQGETLVTVNGDAITQEMVDVTLDRIPPKLREQLEQTGQLGQIQEQLIVGDLLYREAVKQGIHQKRDVQVALALAERSALADSLIKKVVAERSTEERIKQYYDEHKVQYAQPQAKVQLIVTETLDAANALKARIEGGEDFGAVAKTDSKDPHSAAENGELGWMKKQDMGGPIGDQVMAADKGALVGPIETPKGTLLFKIQDKRDAVPLEEVKDDIKAALESQLIDEYIKEVRDAATVVEPAKATVDADAKPADAKPADAKPAPEKAE